MSPQPVSTLDTLTSVDERTPPSVVQDLFETDGAFIVRRLFEPGQISEVREPLLSRLNSSGWISDPSQDAPDANMSLCCSDPDTSYMRTYRRAISAPSIHKLPHSRSVRVLAEQLGFGQFFLHPRVILRMIFPGVLPTPAHQDWTSVGGATDAATVWVPLVPCDLSTGPLAVIRRSHQRGEWARQPALGIEGEEIVTEDSDRWAASALRLGDAVVFRSLTVHCAMPNTSQSLRLSMDFRMQALSAPIHPGSLLPPERFRTWDDVYAMWGEEDRKQAYYWRERHPPLKPSIAELQEDLTRTAGAENAHIERMLKYVM
jgi:hypothetical protein